MKKNNEIFKKNYIKKKFNEYIKNEENKPFNKAGLLLALKMNKIDLINFKTQNKKKHKDFLYELENCYLYIENWLLIESLKKGNSKYNTNNLYQYVNSAFIAQENLKLENESKNNENKKIIINIDKPRSDFNE